MQYSSVEFGTFEYTVGDIEHSLQQPSLAHRIDRNRDKVLDGQELAAALGVTTNIVQGLIYDIDINDDGVVTLREFDHYVAQRQLH